MLRPERLAALRAAVVTALWTARGSERRNLEAQLRLLEAVISRSSTSAAAPSC